MRAAVFLALVACGDGVTQPDAPPSVDGPERGLVTVRVEQPAGTPDIRVWFQNADSTLALATRPNAEGEASALMAPGGFVTVYQEPFAPIGLYTWTGVQPGDVLTLDLTFSQFGDAQPNLSLRIDPIENGLDYFVFNRCESFVEVSQAIDAPFAPFFQDCTSRSDLLLVARDQSAELVGYRFTNDANLQSTATLDMRGPYSPFEASVDVVGPANTNVSVLATLANVFYTTGTSAHIATSRVSVPMKMPNVATATAQYSARTLDGAIEKEDPQPSVLTTMAWGPANQIPTLDLSTPRIRIASRPMIDLESYELRWTETDDGERGDVVWAQVGFSNNQWIVMGARTDETVLRLPVLPFEGLRFQDPATVYVDNLVLIAAEGGYDRLRSYLLGHWSPTNGTWWPMNEPSGRVNFRSTR